VVTWAQEGDGYAIPWVSGNDIEGIRRSAAIRSFPNNCGLFYTPLKGAGARVGEEGREEEEHQQMNQEGGRHEKEGNMKAALGVSDNEFWQLLAAGGANKP
jgi:hypothetical protein